MNYLKILVYIFIASFCFCISSSLPTIDPGVFVLQGVHTCRKGKGYCVLGTNCSIDKDFEFDNEGGNCSEVTKSFTSMLSFVCCRFVRDKEEGEDAYHTTLLPFTIMEEKFQVLDQNPIPVDESDDTEITDEDIENLVNIVGVVTDLTGIISLVTQPYKPPDISSTSSTTTLTIASADIPMTFEENDGSSQDVSPASTSASISTTIDLTNYEDSNPSSAGQETVDQPTAISTSSVSTLIEKVNLPSITSRISPSESTEIQLSNDNTTTSMPDIYSDISRTDAEHIINILTDDITPAESSDRVSSSSTYTTASEADIISDASSTTNVYPLNSSAEATNSRIPTNVTESTSTSTGKGVSNSTPLATTTVDNTKEFFSVESIGMLQDVNTDFEITNQTVLSSEAPISQKSTNTESTPSQDFTTLSSTLPVQEAGNTADIDVLSTTTSKLMSNVVTQEIESHDNYRKTDETQDSDSNEISLINQVQVLNLPEEIRNYLAKKQAENKLTTEQVKSTLDTKEEEPLSSTTTTKDTTVQNEEPVDENVTSTTPFSVTELSMSTETYPSIKPSPLAPLTFDKTDQENFKTEKEELSTEFLYNEEKGNNWIGQDEFVTTTYITTLLQKFDGPNFIELNSERREESNERLEENTLPHPINLNICGLKTPNLMLSEHARAASTYDWCWSAALMRKEGRIDRFECSGTLIELDLVVTTAACLKRLRNKDLSNYRIVLGDSNLRDELPYGVQYLDIDEIVTHPDYLTSGGAHANDIGIIRLREVAMLDHNVCLACISQRNAYIPTHTCVASGYTLGNIPQDIKRDVEGFTPMEGILRESLVSIQEPSDCQSSVMRLAPNPLLVANPNSFLCDGKMKSARACTNTLDGGSPLVCEVGGRWFLVGIASWSRDCSSDPNIYTRVSSFSDWFLNTRLRMYGFVSHRL